MFLKIKKLQAFLWLLLVTVLLCLPGSTLPDTGGNWFDRIHGDKWIHIILFATLVFLGCRAVVYDKMLPYAKIAVLATLYGILMEFVQLWLISGRGFELYDIMADAVGSCTGCIIFLQRKKSMFKH